MAGLRSARFHVNAWVIGYGLFCVAAVTACFWGERILFGALPAKGFFTWTPVLSMVRWGILFLVGLPVVGWFSRYQAGRDKMARTDEVTGLANHRQLFEILDQELSRAKRYEQQLSVMMIDIDNFKSANDSHGHLAGDQLLRDLSSLFTRNIREIDRVGRYGGDEFLVILPHTGPDEAQRLAWRLWSHVHQEPFKVREKVVHLSISLGISSLQDLGKDVDKLTMIHEADEAMFDAKNAKYKVREKKVAVS